MLIFIIFNIISYILLNKFIINNINTYIFSRYLAGLRCDGTERDPADEDPTEFIIWDSEYLGIQEKNKEKFFIDRACSVTSQDTEADVNLDLELVSKEDIDSSRSKFI